MSTSGHAQRVRSAVSSLPEIMEPGRPHRGRGLAVPRSHEDVGFAPVRDIERVCQSRAGRWRRAHVPDQESRCIFCDQEDPR